MTRRIDPNLLSSKLSALAAKYLSYELEGRDFTPKGVQSLLDALHAAALEAEMMETAMRAGALAGAAIKTGAIIAGMSSGKVILFPKKMRAQQTAQNAETQS